MKKEIKLMQVELDDTDILIRIPIDLLVYAQEWRDSPFRITDKEVMTKWIVKNLLSFTRYNTSEISNFEVFLDEMFDEAIESGELWLEQEFGQE
ncbi:MAG: hypothetical protein IMZ52_00290 [Actinobacteria bacterium]|nr:hypothetical protein [Actinomycetota bacterium]